ncbi:hypothetical protein Kisp02_42770 [Kineosporia sp. NBRC 101731]|nr:hypothetical protein Kisp02_42770 [Kineosporia sp. NBRC 101731]
MPEFDDVARLAAATGRAERQVLEEVCRAAADEGLWAGAEPAGFWPTGAAPPVRAGGAARVPRRDAGYCNSAAPDPAVRPQARESS